MLNLSDFIDFDNFDNFTTINQNDRTTIVTALYKNSPSKKKLFKIFNFSCTSSKYQKIILDKFCQINSIRCQYLITYRKISLFNKSELTPTFSVTCISTQTLDDVLQNPDILKKWNISNILECFFAICEGMRCLHHNLLYHGNLCPSNIIIDEANQFYLIDYGLYLIKKLYVDSSKIFNKDYKDPLIKNSEPTFKNDVYSYGVLMCHLLHETNKEKNENFQEFLSNQNKDKFKIFQPFFSELIQLCLDQDVSKRPTFDKISEIFQNAKKSEFEEANISKLYKEFINKNYLINLSEMKNSYAMNKVGKMYKKGEVFKKNVKKALHYFKKGSDLDNSESKNLYGDLLIEDGWNKKPNYKVGAEFLRQSAEEENIHGLNNYGLIFYRGQGVNPDISKCKEFIKKSADFGCSEAQLNYGYILVNENGQSPEKIEEGLKYLRKGMDQNNPEAFCSYAFLLKEGKNINQNMKLAMEYFKIAADEGNKDAIIEFANGNFEGNGVKKNLQTALKYYRLAQALNYKTKEVQLKIDKIVKRKNDNQTPKKEKSIQTSETANNNNDESHVTVNNENSNQKQINEIETKKEKQKSNTELHKSNENNENKNKKSSKIIEGFHSQNEKDNELSESLIIDLNRPTTELIKLGDAIIQIDSTGAFKCYNEAINRGDTNALLKCARMNFSFETSLKYYELAIKNNIEGSFSEWRRYVIKRAVTIKNDIEQLCKLAHYFEKKEDFTDAAYLYEMIKDNLNFQICYEKAKINIDKVVDGQQLFYFGILAQKENENELALILYKKSYENNFDLAMNKINEIEKIIQQKIIKSLTNVERIVEEGIDYYEGRNGKIINYSIALKLFEEASKMGSSKADYYIGKHYKNEYGAGFLKKAADAGDLDCQNCYGNYLLNGIGVEKNYFNAMKYFKMAADQGHAEASFEYGKNVFDRAQSEDEKKKGILYIKNAAQKLFPDAIFMYSKIIQKTNPFDSKKFLEYSLEKGSKLAKQECKKH